MEAILAGDIGATNTRLALYPIDRNIKASIRKEEYISARFSGLAEVVSEFLLARDYSIDCAVFAVAGPVVEQKVKVTNLPWHLDAEVLKNDLALPDVHLMNDLQAVANGVPILAEEHLHTLNVGSPEPNGPIAVISPGTGLGEAFLTWDGVRYRAHDSEGGHSEFGPTDDFQVDLLNYMLERHEHVSYERVCSGIGIPNLYEFLRDRVHLREPDWLTDRLSGSDDITPIVVEAALDSERALEICEQTLNLFVDILGAEASNLALKVLSTGGVYVGGGIPPRILAKLEERFMLAFANKGRFTDLVNRMPVKVILNSDVALIGAAAVGLQLLE